MRYNGLHNKMAFFAKFCFIYEKEIKQMVRSGEFESCFKTAFDLYEQKMKCHARYAKEEEIDSIVEYAQFTLFFTQGKSHILDFCRHLRNSFNHGILVKDDKKLIINDKKTKNRKENCEQITSKGFLEYKLVEEFVKYIVNVYEHNNKNETIMEKQKSLEKLGCSFYNVEGTNVQVGITSGGDWKDIAVFKLENGKVMMLPAESNDFRGERLNRKTWSQLEWLKSFGINKALPIDEEKADSVLKEYVKDFLSNH